MDCKKCNELISDYIDGLLYGNDKVDFENHVHSCMECSKSLEVTKKIVSTLNQLELVDAPKDLSDKVLLAIKKEKGIQKMSIKKIVSYAAVFICGIFITSLFFQSPFSNNTSTADLAAVQENSQSSELGNGLRVNETAKDDVINSEEIAQGSVKYDQIFDKDKIIYQGTINLDVKDSKKSSSNIESYIQANGGFLESSYNNKNEINQNEIYNQSFIVVRVPSAKFQDTMEKIKGFGEVTSTNINSTNISTQYKDINSEKESLEIQEERLLNYLKETKKVEEMITIESELNRVRTNLNSINTQLSNYDQQISYSTITVNLREAKTLTTTIKSPFGKLLEQISKGFISSINLLLQLISILVVLVFRIIPFLIVIIPIVLIIRKKLKR